MSYSPKPPDPKTFRWNVARLKKFLRNLDDNIEIVVASDEELNSIHIGIDVDLLVDEGQPERLIFVPLTGLELET